MLLRGSTPLLRALRLSRLVLCLFLKHNIAATTTKIPRGVWGGGKKNLFSPFHHILASPAFRSWKSVDLQRSLDLCAQHSVLLTSVILSGLKSYCGFRPALFPFFFFFFFLLLLNDAWRWSSLWSFRFVPGLLNKGREDRRLEHKNKKERKGKTKRERER